MSPRIASNSLTPSGFFVLRTPLLPWSTLSDWGRGLRAASASRRSPQELDEAVAADRARLREGMSAIVRQPVVRQALFIASPSAEQAAQAWLEDPKCKDAGKLETVLTRYLARMAGRATPFGLFGGGSLGLFGDRTRLRLAAQSEYRSHTRLDMEYLGALAQRLSAEPTLREALRFSPNSGLYTAAGRRRLAEWQLDPETSARRYQLIAMPSTGYLERTLERAATGVRLEELVPGLCRDVPDVSPANARAFLDELVDAQILVPALEPPVTGEPALEAMLETLREATGPQSTAHLCLDQARREIEALDESLGAEPGRHRAIAQGLAKLQTPKELGRLFHVDLHKPAPEARLGAAVIDEVGRAIDLVHRIASIRPPSSLDDFRSAFQRRYGMREVSLMEALDEEAGIGFAAQASVASDPSPLLSGLPFDQPSPARVAWGDREALLFQKLCRAIEDGANEIELDEADLEDLEIADPAPLPDALAARITLAAESESELAAGRFRVLWHGASGPSGVTAMGRFCHGDAELQARVREHLEQEEAHQPDAIFAEVVHLPNGRMGNILTRPLLRRYEIAYHGRSGAEADDQIPVSDLVACVVGDRIVLRSIRLGRQVIPRHTTAHNSSRAELGVYRFLSALQYQGVAGNLAWDWGPLADAPFLPRLSVGRLVLSLATWKLSQADLGTLAAPAAADRFRNVQALRERRNLPRWVSVVEADRRLPLDLENSFCVDALVDLARSRDALELSEVFPATDEQAVSGPEGRFAHELLVPFVRDVPAEQPSAGLPMRSRRVGVAPACKQRQPRVFGPGSEWLFAKIYSGRANADQVLVEAVAPVVRAVRDSGACDRWFFLRLADPDPHVRVRFHGSPDRLRGEVLPALAERVEALVDAGAARGFQLDGYERELERYGGEAGIECAEALFELDSDAAIALLSSGAAATSPRWQLALLSAHQLMQDFGLDLAARCRLLETFRDELKREFGTDRTLDHALGRKYRPLRRDLDALLEADLEPEGETLARPRAILAERSSRLRPVWRDLETRARRCELSQPLESIALSLVHMSTNRLLPSAARAHELVFYDFLSRTYRSRLARSRSVAEEVSASRVSS